MGADQTGRAPDEPRQGGLSAALRSVRAELIASWAGKVEREVSAAPLPTVELMDHMPAFVDELIARAAKTGEPLPRAPLPSEPAEQHGVQRLRLGFNVGEVVREYGLLHECVLEEMNRIGYRMDAADQKLIARSVSQGIADAVSLYVSQRDSELARQASEHVGFIAHEVRNGLATSLLAYQGLRRPDTEASGPFERLGRSLRSIAEVVNNALTQSWLRMGLVPKTQGVPLRAFLEQLVLDLGADARDRSVDMVLDLPRHLVIAADPRLLRSAVSNLVTNALKFSPPGANITVRASTGEGRLYIEVADQCGGLPPGKAEELFSPFVQKHDNRAGFGLGLAIVRQAAEAHGGTIKVRDVPGYGCVFRLDLPLVHQPPAGAT
jgi:signal transduction histidine kinase